MAKAYNRELMLRSTAASLRCTSLHSIVVALHHFSGTQVHFSDGPASIFKPLFDPRLPVRRLHAALIIPCCACAGLSRYYLMLLLVNCIDQGFVKLAVTVKMQNNELFSF